MKVDILGQYKFVNKHTWQPHKRCVDCILFDDSICFCHYLNVKVQDWEYNKSCPVIEITIEEE